MDVEGGKAGMSLIVVHVDLTPDEHRELKKLAIDKGQPMGRIVGALVRSYLRQTRRETRRGGG